MPRRVQDIVPNTHRSIRDLSVERNDISAPVQPPRKKGAQNVINLKAQEGRGDRGKATRELDERSSSRMTSIEESQDKKETTEEEILEIKPRRLHETPEPPVVKTPRANKKKNSGSKKWLFVLMGIVVVVAGVGYVASVYFSRATFSIVAKTVPVSINGTYIAQASGGKGGLTYELAAVKGTAAATVVASDGPTLSTSAKGKIIIYNSSGTTSQRLIAGTRLSDDTGRIYRLAGSIVIPGYTTTGSTIVPGSISATVTADQPGQSYNIGKADSVSDFRIVAYKGTPKYDTIYGRLSGEIAGGFVGTKKTVSPQVLASTTVELQAKITSTLADQIKSTLPEGYIMYRTAYVTSFGTPVISGSDPKSATVTLQGTLYGIIFKKSDLVARVAGDQAIASFDGFAYDAPGFDSLDFTIANPKDFSPEKKNSLIIKLKGDASLVGSVPVEIMKTKLAGLSLADTTAVLRSYKPVIEIEQSSGEITPPWSKVPTDPSRITIKLQ